MLHEHDPPPPPPTHTHTHARIHTVAPPPPPQPHPSPTLSFFFFTLSAILWVDQVHSQEWGRNSAKAPQNHCADASSWTFCLLGRKGERVCSIFVRLLLFMITVFITVYWRSFVLHILVLNLTILPAMHGQAAHTNLQLVAGEWRPLKPATRFLATCIQ